MTSSERIMGGEFCMCAFELTEELRRPAVMVVDCRERELPWICCDAISAQVLLGIFGKVMLDLED
jgi:hypothetical protein